MTAPTWLVKAWAWLKANWKWLLFPVGLLLLLVGRASAKREVTVVSPGLVEHEEVEKKLDEEAAAKKQAADEKAQQQLSGIEASRSATVASETQKQMDAAAAVRDDPDALNDYLKNVGKDMRR
jgi:hypothetical protein